MTINFQAGAGEVILSALAPGTDVAPHFARARIFFGLLGGEIGVRFYVKGMVLLGADGFFVGAD